MLKRVTRVLHAIDHAVGRLGRLRRILVDVRTPVYTAVLGPVYRALAEMPDTAVWFTSEYPERVRPLVDEQRFVTHAEAEWQRFDLYVNADPWAAARLRRCDARVNFFHGVAGKYDLDEPRNLPMGFEYYDRVAFINRDRMARYLAAGIVTEKQARLVGYPKLDALAAGRLDGAAVRASLMLHPDRPTSFYAPTYSTASSLHLAGEEIVRTLAAAGTNVIVKLHDRSLDSDPRYTGGIDWRARMRALEERGRIVFVEGADASPYLAAADVMVTDHSSIGFEYLVLDRPLIVYDAPDLAAPPRINRQKIELLRSAATVVRDTAALSSAVAHQLAFPREISGKRRQVAESMFFDPGSATERALTIARELLRTPGSRRSVALAPGEPARRSLS